ncbi:MAG: hypothetical protein WKF74_12305 [Pyrinomonadaceae bacterium]
MPKESWLQSGLHPLNFTSSVCHKQAALICNVMLTLSRRDNQDSFAPAAFEKGRKGALASK